MHMQLAGSTTSILSAAKCLRSQKACKGHAWCMTLVDATDLLASLQAFWVKACTCVLHPLQQAHILVIVAHT
jgi:hypothetical protein